MKKFDERLAELSERLAVLSKKAEDASVEAKEAREMKQEAIQDQISTVKGDVVAFQENAKLEAEEEKSKLRTALLKAQMTMEAKRQDRKDARDKAHLEDFMDDRILTAVDCLDVADYMIANALVNMLEFQDAAIEYVERFGDTEE